MDRGSFRETEHLTGPFLLRLQCNVFARRVKLQILTIVEMNGKIYTKWLILRDFV